MGESSILPSTAARLRGCADSHCVDEVDEESLVAFAAANGQLKGK
jgi:hypothetical protein